MKKTLLSVASSVAFAAVVALVGCAPTTVSYDTVESIGAPKVTAKTYAGVVHLTWNAVKGAGSYVIYKDGEPVPAMFIGSNPCEYVEYATASNNLVDGVKYTYDVVAVPKGNYAHAQKSARELYIKENQTSVTVKAKVPTPEEFKEEYKSYFDKFASEKIEFKTELVTGGNWDRYIMVTAPTLPEFKYQIETYVEVPSPFRGTIGTATFGAFTFTKNDAATLYALPILGAGDIKTSVKVIPLSPLYQETKFETDDLHVSALKTTKKTAARKAWYVDSETVHLEWTPAELNGVCYDPADYSVYGYFNGTYTKVEGEIKVLNPGDFAKDEYGIERVVTQTTYCIEDTVAKGDAKKTYYTTLYKDYDYEDYYSWDGWDVYGGYEFEWQNSRPAINGTDNRKAWYVDSTTVHLEWTPASLNGVYCAPADYSVYGYLNGVYTKVEGDVKVLNPGDFAKDMYGMEYVVTQTTYYIKDTVTEGDARKTYYTALYIENENEWNTSSYEFSWQDSNVWYYDVRASAFDDGKTIRVSFTPDTTDSVSMYTVYRKLSGADTIEKIGALKEGKQYSLSNHDLVKTEIRYFYVDDKVENVANYEYTLYKKINGTLTSVGSASVSSIVGVASVDLSVLPFVADQDGVKNDVYITVTTYDVATRFTLLRAKYTGNVVFDSEFEVVDLHDGYGYVSNNDDGWSYIYNFVDKKDVLNDGNYIYKVVAEADGKLSSTATAIAELGYVTDDSFTTANLYYNYPARYYNWENSTYLQSEYPKYEDYLKAYGYSYENAIEVRDSDVPETKVRDYDYTYVIIDEKESSGQTVYSVVGKPENELKMDITGNTSSCGYAGRIPNPWTGRTNTNRAVYVFKTYRTTGKVVAVRKVVIGDYYYWD